MKILLLLTLSLILLPVLAGIVIGLRLGYLGIKFNIKTNKSHAEDCPRNANGWPTITPQEMTDVQVKYEAVAWRRTASGTARGTVAGMMWSKYYDELVRRGLADPDLKYDHPIIN